MRYQHLGMIACIGTLAAPGAHAQYATQTVALAGGPTRVGATLADTLRPGFNVIGSVAFHWAARRLTLRFDGMYNQFDKKLSTDRARLWGFTGNLEIDPFGNIGPYGIAGWGMYQSMRSGTTGPSTFQPGVNGGGGIRLPVSAFTIFGEMRVHRVLGSGKPELTAISFGLRV